MVKQAVVLAAVAALAVAATGCGIFQPAYYQPYGAGLGPDIARCPHRVGRWASAETYGSSCGEAMCGEYASAGCGTCGACGQPYGPADCGPYTDGHCGPLTLVFALFRHHCFWGAGCGGRYYGEWLSDPPDCSEPCDFSAPGVPYEPAAGPSESIPCTECQGAVSQRQPGRAVVRRSPPPAPRTSATGGRPATRPAGYAARPEYPSRAAYKTPQVPQVVRPQTAPASYAY